MQVNSINQSQKKYNTNYKGTISKNAMQIINSYPENVALAYIKSLEKGVRADKAKLIEIKELYKKLFQSLNRKVRKMHPDTIMEIELVKNAWGYKDTYFFTFKNKNINASYHCGHLPNLNEFVSAPEESTQIYQESIRRVHPKNIDLGIYEQATCNLHYRIVKEDNIRGYKKEFAKILKYGNELPQYTKEMAENEASCLKYLLKKRRIERAQIKKEQEVEEYNYKLFTEVFCSNKK